MLGALLLVACNRARVLAEDALGGALLTRHVIRMLRQTNILHYFTVLCLHQTVGHESVLFMLCMGRLLQIGHVSRLRTCPFAST